MNSNIFRIIDANGNRLTEGLRVCEDISRFILCDKKTTRAFKALRHQAFLAFEALGKRKNTLIGSRDSDRDIGRKTTRRETRRRNAADIFTANVKRSEEAARSLEEFSKLVNRGLSERFKKIRFRLYSAEKGIVKKLQAVRYCRQRNGRQAGYAQDR